ncbi:MAG: HEAT repeat domain-containing protein [Candidatus Ratteibacteria bacterium]
MALLCLVISVITTFFCQADENIRVGIFSENRQDVAVTEISHTLKEKGMEVRTLTKKDINEGKIYDCDALFFGGGWNQYNWLDLSGRIHLVEYVESRGGGVIFSIFRCGWAARSGIRPLFPEVAQAYNKSNGPGIIVTDQTHPIMKGFPERFMTPYYDHAVMRMGSQGKVLAVDTNGDVAIACGESGRGRVVFLGPWIGVNADGKPAYPLPPHDERLLLNSLAWARGNLKKTGENTGNISDQVKLKVLRREKILDWTHDDRGISWYPGLLAEAFYTAEERLDNLSFRTAKLRDRADNIAQMKELLAITDRLMALKNRLKDRYEQAKRRKTDEIMILPISALEAEPPRDLSIRRNARAMEKNQTIVIEWTNRLLPLYLIEPVAKKIKKIEEETVSVHKKSVLEPENANDVKSVGDLIRLLDNREYQVRRDAIYALGWRQAMEAVPALLKLSNTTKDIRTRRRAVEALGLIGDRRATTYLIKSLKDSDRFVRQNAILSLGWLGDTQAVTPLIQVLALPLENENSGHTWTREDRLCAIRALGHIGERKAIPAIKEFYEKRKEGKGTRDFYFTSLRIDEAVDLALKEIDQGGRRKSGIQQPIFLRNKKNIDRLTDTYHAFYGRAYTYDGRPENWKTKIDYAAENGGTGFTGDYTLTMLNGGGWLKKQVLPVDDFLSYLSETGIITLPYWYRRGTAVFDKAGFEYDALQWGKYPALTGYWSEEALWWDKELRDERMFREYLSGKYSHSELASFGIKDISKVKCPESSDAGRQEKFLFAEYMEYLADTGVEIWQEMAEWLTALRKGTSLSYSLSSRYAGGTSTYISAYPRLIRTLGSVGPQSYECHSFLNNFNLELHRNGEARTVLGEFYSHQSDVSDRVERGFAASFVYGQAFYAFNWAQLFKHAPGRAGSCGGWEKGRWEAAERQFHKGQAISEYLVRADSPKLVCQLYSGRTSTLTYGSGSPDGIYGGRMRRYTQNQAALWECLTQTHVPTDILWLETLDDHTLSKYKIALLSDAKSLSNREVTMIQKWVRDGGVLIATGGVSLHDQWDRPRKNYALEDLFGVQYIGTEIANKESFRNFIERDISPNTVEKVSLIENTYRADADTESFSYERKTGCDMVTPTTGKVIGIWQDGSAAMVENKYGRGLSIFLSPIYLGLSHNTIGWTVEPLYLQFWSGVQEVIASCIKRGLEFSDTELPIEVTNCPPYVEVTLREQKEQNRVMVHALNLEYHPGLEIVKNMGINLKVAEKSVKDVYYPYPEKSSVSYHLDGGNLQFTIRDFDIHEMVVVEFK